MAPFVRYYNSELTLRIGAAFLAACAFFVANRHAFSGFFSADDLDTLTWAAALSWRSYAEGLLSLGSDDGNFRPTGAFLYQLLFRMAGFQYAPYVAAAWSLHFAAAGLLFWLLRRILIPALPAFAGTLFFAFHPALFDAWWKPMFWFDVLCALFSVVALLAWHANRPVPAMLAFWLAIKSKEHAVLLPLALAALRPSWWLLPFAAASLAVGVQGILFGIQQKAAYRLTLSGDALRQTIPFYAPWLAPLLAAPAVRFWFPLALLATLAPLLLLPTRLFTVYLYLPALGVATALAAIFARLPRAVYLPLLAAWFVYTYLHLRDYRRIELDIARENRAYFTQVMAQSPTTTRHFFRDGDPRRFEPWGVDASLRHAGFPRNLTTSALDIQTGWQDPNSVVLSWDRITRQLLVSPYPATLRPFLQMTDRDAVWQLDRGFLPLEGSVRPIRDSAVLRLAKPPVPRRLHLSWRGLPTARPNELNILLNNQWLGAFPYQPGQAYATSWPIPWPLADTVVVELRPGGDRQFALESIGIR